MENTNPPLSPSEVALLREQIENEIRELREVNRLVKIELNQAFSDLATALYLNKDLGTNDLEDVVEELEEGEIDPKLDDYFNLYPTKKEITNYNNLIDNPRSPFTKIEPKIKRGDPKNAKIPYMIGYKHIENAYIDFKSPINIMSSSVYNDIVKTRLGPRRDPKYPEGVCNFFGRIKGLHVFVGDFTYITNFMVVEDLVNVIDCRLSHVVFSKPFVEKSKLEYDEINGTIRFANKTDRITYKMPNKMKEFHFVPRFDLDKIGACEDINEEDRNKGMGYVWEKRNLFYKDCLALGPKYKVDRELATRMLEAIEKKANELYEEHLQSGLKYKTGLEDDLESGTNDEVT
jgi:hypothetical protein